MEDTTRYTVGWICGILTKFTAARACFDETYPSNIANSFNGDVVYALGRVGLIDVVVAAPLNWEHKPGSATVVAQGLLSRFPNIRIGFMVGIGGGAPSPDHDIRLGDVVVGSGDGGQGGVLQYDFGKSLQSHDVSFEHTMPLNQPPAVINNAITRDKVAKEKSILCFETEAAGLTTHFPYLVVRGICHYSDSYQDKKWEDFAALAAAAYTAELLDYIAYRTISNDSEWHEWQRAPGSADESLAAFFRVHINRNNQKIHKEDSADGKAGKAIQDGKAGKDRNALHIAPEKVSVKIKQWLPVRGSDVNVQSVQHGNTLQAASKAGLFDIVKILLDKGADVNAQGGQYGNALQAASREGHTDIVEILLAKGAVVDVRGGQYGTALQGALTGGHVQIVQMLRNKANLRAYGYDRFRLQWEIPELYKQMRPTSLPTTGSEVMSFLSGLIIITGDEETFECSTCSEFLHKRWHYAGSVALRIMSIGLRLILFPETVFLQGPEREDNPPDHYGIDRFLVRRSTTEEIEVQFCSGSFEARDVVDALIWISTAIRSIPSTNTSPGLFRSKSFGLDSSRSREFISKLRPLEEWHPMTSSTSSYCWTQLFRTGVIAWRNLRRDWGRGLEMSFDLMVHLASVENYYALHGGIVLLGFTTALVPVEQNKDSKSIQWHFEVTEGSTDDFIEPAKLQTIQRTWTKFQSKSEFQGSKCFVGWFDKAHVLLGTRKLLERTSMTWSQTEERLKTPHQKGIEAGGQNSIRRSNTGRRYMEAGEESPSSLTQELSKRGSSRC
ncbi:hypothetical protein CCUS01_08818 [Colletotrichum cuscutae]|uniref:Nucleoside phosphorylase domain-containing protein n=1 Tax=Colletotrichum cuscutae TaxID=1209917 RepID=A0AAI9ULI4_9PEZI|nr:hypothetical protein CCUS01_08818 [Colletotrichum cuscutae]